ncbi:phosphoribosylglycinamide formyltransferase [Lachnospiraceae bacterium NSJ-143]|nr:phosphoribosylglycinamide formyltransferase [Lachnospiraceae bacterium NSJ-143]
MLKIGVLVSGGGTNLQAIIDSIESGYIKNAEIVTVISSNPEAYALKRAEKHGISGICIRKRDFQGNEEFLKALEEHLESLGVELIVLAGFMTVLGKSFTEKYKNRIINIHPALIPSFCGDGFYGLKVHEAALEKGVKITGATVHFVNEETDGGPIILQKAVNVEDNDTPETLQRRVMEQAEWKIFPEAVKLISEGKIMVEGNKVRRLL